VPLTPGSKLGIYEIVAPLGAGGMGEVYRARDTKLGRDVAIKALPSQFAQDPDRLSRFEREAKLLASLSHPYIAGIFGLEDIDNHRYLVLEYVEGQRWHNVSTAARSPSTSRCRSAGRSRPRSRVRTRTASRTAISSPAT
jgi:serine/threonine protein kinase